MSKTESNIAIFLLYLFLFLAAGMSYVTIERVAALDEKIKLRDSLMMDHIEKLYLNKENYGK